MSDASSQRSVIAQCVFDELERYFQFLDGEPAFDVHQLVVSECERAAIDYVMQHCNNNKSRAAKTLGISRGTLATKLDAYKAPR